MEDQDKSVEECKNKIFELVRSYEAQIGYELTFPLYKELPELPEEVKLALAVLNRHKVKITLVIEPKKP